MDTDIDLKQHISHFNSMMRTILLTFFLTYPYSCIIRSLVYVIFVKLY